MTYHEVKMVQCNIPMVRCRYVLVQCGIVQTSESPHAIADIGASVLRGLFLLVDDFQPGLNGGNIEDAINPKFHLGQIVDQIIGVGTVDLVFKEQAV